ncbi:MAG: hypothetical protein HY927_04130 [Elusimicrobia bacterium]|nr:hypothetical protein [Elusimicrobiota bacterium]
MRNVLLLVLTVSCLSSRAGASACGYGGKFFDGSIYKLKPGHKLQSIPVYDQGEHEWCWSYMTSQMIDACLLREGSAGDKFTSPIYFGIQLAKGFDEGHETDDLLGLWKKITPRCRGDKETVKLALMKAFLNDGVGFGLDGHKPVGVGIHGDGIKLKGLHGDRQLHQAIEKILTLNRKLKTDASLPQARRAAAMEKVCRKFLETTYETGSPGELDDLTGVCLWSLQKKEWDFWTAGTSVKEAISVSAQPFLQAGKDLQCAPDAAKCVPHWSQQAGTFERTVDENLKGGVPTGIDFCSTILSQGAAAKADTMEKFGDPGTVGGEVFKKECGYHAALIVGSRQKAGVKEYLIRNSWGTGCDGNGDWPCQCGHAWVKAATLLRNIGQVSWIR